MSNLERSEQIRTRMVADFETTLRRNAMTIGQVPLTELADDAMFHVEHLLAEIAQLNEQVWALERVTGTRP